MSLEDRLAQIANVAGVVLVIATVTLLITVVVTFDLEGGPDPLGSAAAPPETFSLEGIGRATTTIGGIESTPIGRPVPTVGQIGRRALDPAAPGGTTGTTSTTNTTDTRPTTNTTNTTDTAPTTDTRPTTSRSSSSTTTSTSTAPAPAPTVQPTPPPSTTTTQRDPTGTTLNLLDCWPYAVPTRDPNCPPVPTSPGPPST